MESPLKFWDRRFPRLLRRNRAAIVGLLIVTVMVCTGVLGPMLAPYDPNTQFRGSRLQSPDREFVLGTDNLGRDLLSRLLHGARLSIGMAALATVFIVAIAVLSAQGQGISVVWSTTSRCGWSTRYSPSRESYWRWR